MPSLSRHLVVPLLLALSACEGLTRCTPAPQDAAATDALYASPLDAPERPMSVFHLGHSLVGRDMPAMLQQLAEDGHRFNSQLGWGTTLKAHWGDDTIEGFETENAHPKYADAAAALDSGDYDAVVLAEMASIRDAIRYHTTPDYLHRWARRAWEADPETRVYLYETWPRLDDPEGWLTRLDLDLERYWEEEVLRRALAYEGMDRPIYVIPAGQVFARFVRALHDRGGVDGLTRKEDLFLTRDGEQDTMHFNDLGAYLLALTHYAVLYHRNPVGLPFRLNRADGAAANAPGPEAARLMQEVVWDVVTGYPKTGVAQRPER